MNNNNNNHFFTTLDYALFAASLAFSLSIGFYHGCLKKSASNSSTKDVLLAGGQMKPIPVALTLVTTFLSAISILGYPSEIYKYGTMFFYYGFAFFIAFPIVAYVFLPKIYQLKSASVYYYLEVRFNKNVKRLASAIFFLETMLYLPVGWYAPALTLNSVMGLPLYMSIIITGFICVIYTTIGGAKTVVWTHVYQFFLIIGGLICIMVTGLHQTGGLGRVIQIANEAGRLNFSDFGFDPRIRHSFWSLIIGGTFMLLSLFSTNQTAVQRYLSMGTLKEAQIAILINAPMHVIILLLYMFVGVILFVSFYGCNPEELGSIKKIAEILPYFVMKKLSYINGLPGIFLSAIYGAGFGVIAAGLNALAAVALEDWVKPLYLHFQKQQMEDAVAVKTCKILTFMFGVCTIFLAYTFTWIDAPILQVALSFFGICSGPILGTFCLGMFFERPNAIGAFIGLLVSMLVMLWIGMMPIFMGIMPPAPPTSIEACSNFTIAEVYSLNSSMINKVPFVATTNFTSSSEQMGNIQFSSWEHCRKSPTGKQLADSSYIPCENVFFEIYKLSYQYYSLLGVILAILVGYFSSLLADCCFYRRNALFEMTNGDNISYYSAQFCRNNNANLMNNIELTATSKNLK